MNTLFSPTEYLKECANLYRIFIPSGEKRIHRKINWVQKRLQETVITQHKLHAMHLFCLSKRLSRCTQCVERARSLIEDLPGALSYVMAVDVDVEKYLQAQLCAYLTSSEITRKKAFNRTTKLIRKTLEAAERNIRSSVLLRADALKRVNILHAVSLNIERELTSHARQRKDARMLSGAEMQSLALLGYNAIYHALEYGTYKGYSI